MKRIYTRHEQDDIVNEMAKLKKEIRQLEEKEYLSEWEFKSLDMKKKKLKYMRGM